MPLPKIIFLVIKELEFFFIFLVKIIFSNLKVGLYWIIHLLVLQSNKFFFFIFVNSPSKKYREIFFSSEKFKIFLILSSKKKE